MKQRHAFSRDSRQLTNQSSQWVSHVRLVRELRRSGGVYNQIFNRRWAAKCQKLVPGPLPSRQWLLPSGHRPGEPKIRQALRFNVRRPSGNKSGNLPPRSLPIFSSICSPLVLLVFGSQSALSILKRNRTWKGTGTCGFGIIHMV